MIYTCTLNPSVDYKMEAQQFQLGALNRPDKAAFYPGGKGINVLRVLNQFGTPNIALGFLGGFTGRFIQEKLNAEGFVHDFIFYEGTTRVNIKLKSQHEETEINGSGDVISGDSQARLLDKISKLTNNDYLILAGSLPSSITFDFYEKIAATCYEKGIKIIIDTSDPKIRKLLSYSPFLLKPNRLELGQILEKELSSMDDLVEGGKALIELGAKNVIISMGGDGALFLSENNIIAYAAAPQGEIKSTVGSGDSMVAGFLSSYLTKKDHLASFQFSVAAGSATAFSDDLCTKEAVESLLSKIHIKEF